MKTQNFDFMKFMTTESTLLEWKSEGLPADSLTLENSIILLNSPKTPLIIDPNSNATEWLKKHFLSEKNLEIMNLSDPKFNTNLELSVRFGKILIV